MQPGSKTKGPLLGATKVLVMDTELSALDFYSLANILINACAIYPSICNVNNIK